MSVYIPTIGLEIHAELSTKTKMFCNSPNNPDETKPNVNICEVCMAHPGALPTINKEAIAHMVKIGVAVGGTIANFTEFDRKSYFYPDIPKGYQISQYKHPIVSGGTLGGVEITRVHLEEDTGLSKHFSDYSLIDFNRAGIPLMELVTEPVIHSPEEAGKFARELQILLRYLKVAEANMEKGEMRVELNISIAPESAKELGVKVEVKNINSFRAMERAAHFEIARMTKLLDDGKGSEIIQETRGWDENKQETFSQRSKENAEDYRYFPEPDLPKMYLHEIFDLKKIESELPELPNEKRERYKNDYGIKDEDIESYIIDYDLGIYFESVAKLLEKDVVASASNYLTSDLVGMKVKNPEMIFPEAQMFAKLIEMNTKGDINSRATKDILAILVEKGGDPEIIAKDNNLFQKSDKEELSGIIDKVIEENDKSVLDYKKGKENVLKFLIGQTMKETKGSGDPKVIEEILKDKLSH